MYFQDFTVNSRCFHTYTSPPCVIPRGVECCLMWQGCLMCCNYQIMQETSGKNHKNMLTISRAIII